MERQGGHAWAVEGDLDPARLASMTAEIESTVCCRRWPETRDPDLAVTVTLSAAVPRFTLA